MKKKKKPFFLIEIFIIFSLISLLALPLARSPMKYFLSEIELLEKIESERIAENTFAEVKQAFYEKKIPWEEMKKHFSRSYYLEDNTIVIDGMHKKNIKRKYQIDLIKEKKSNDSIYRLIKITISLIANNWKNENQATFFLLLEKKCKLEKIIAFFNKKLHFQKRGELMHVSKKRSI